jgi:hypothetical protein
MAMRNQKKDEVVRLDCAAARMSRPIVLWTFEDKPAAGEVLQAGDGCVHAEERQTLSSFASPAAEKSMVRVVGRGILLLAMLATCAAAWADDKKPADPNQGLFDQVKKMNFTQQQAWLTQLERRALLAAQLTLPPAEGAKQQSRTRSLLHQKTVTWQVLGQVLAETEAYEKTVEVAKRPVAKKEIVKTQAAEKATAKSQPVVHVAAKPQAVDSGAAPEERLPPGSVTVNTEELDARIAGCNLAFREIEAELGDRDAAWNAGKLEPLLERLKILVLRHNDLGLYCNAVPKDERSALTQLESSRSAISQFSARVVEARNRANDPKSFAAEAERQAELARLGAISRGVAELGEK